MKSADVRKKFIEFYKARGHVEVPSASLVPENDSTTLFTSSGMQPLVPYLLGQPHPLGTRIVNSQKSFRAQDIEEVGNNRHTTFFEMLGNWSLGDYFKEEQLSWIWEFLTKELVLPKDRLWVSVFEGDTGVPRDEESARIWKSLGVPEEKILYYDVTKNWWSRAGEPAKMPAGEPGGPDSEVFFDFGVEYGFHERFVDKEAPCHPNCDCGRFMEIANSVFMQYRKRENGSLEELPNKNVDFGGGLERMAAATNDDPDVFNTDFFNKAKQQLDEIVLSHTVDGLQSIRIILDHIRASMFIVDAGVTPSNKEQGYILRRLIRRAALHSKLLNIDLEKGTLTLLLKEFSSVYASVYSSVQQNRGVVSEVISEEIEKFEKTLNIGMKQILSKPKGSTIPGRELFDYYQTYGYPIELVTELAQKNELFIDAEGYEEAREKHRDLSRTSSAGMFKGGLADRSEATTKLHTATHLLHQALRTILGSHVQQKGSNITSERLRFDFSHPTKLTDDELQKISDLVNEKIKENLPISFTIMDTQEALKSGALAFFGERYGEKVKVYSIGEFSREICGGPHVSFTATLGRFTIMKEESPGAGIRRIYANVQE